MPSYIRTRSEFAVNSFWAGYQTAPAVSTFADGGFVIVWGSNDSEQDGSWSAIKAQLFDSTGSKVGTEFLINQFGGGSQFTASVATLGNGNFVVTWANSISDPSELTGGGNDGISARLFDRSGAPIGTEFQVDNGSSTSLFAPEVVSLANGGFLIVWDTFVNGDIKGRIYDSAGSPAGAEFTLNANTSASQDSADITALANGGFVATWRTTDGAADGSGEAVKGQIFSASGTRVGAEFLVNSAKAGEQYDPSITALSGGSFVVTWSTRDTAQDGSGGAVKAQIFDASGAKSGGEFLVNTQAADTQRDAAVTGTPDGGFVVVWTNASSSQDGSGSALKAQAFDSAGAKVGAEMLVNTLTGGSQSLADIAVLADGRVVVTWASESGDGDGYSVRAQILGAEVAAPLPNSAPIIISDGGGASVSLAMDEGLTAVTRVVASDDGELNNLRYSISGPDSALFTIDAFTGALAFIQPMDHESPLDQGQDNFYDLTVTASDGQLTDSQSIQIQLRHVNYVDIVSDGGQSWTEIWMGENRTAVTTVQAVDDDGLALTYAIADGDDSAFFTIDPQTGKLSFAAAPDYEWPQDMYGDNIYNVVVTATDGTTTDWQYISVYIEDVFETDGFAIVSDGGEDSAEILAPENQTGVTFVTVQNAVGEVTYEIVGGVDSSWFTIDPATGELSFNQARDFEAGERYSPWGYPDPNGHDNSFEIIVRASDGQSVDEQHLTILVENVDEAPIFYSPWGYAYQPGEAVDLEIFENRLRAGDIIAYDPDGQSPGSSRVTFSIAGGPDSALFEIDPESGALKFIGSARPDYEAPGDADGDNVYEVSITAHSGWLSTTQAVEIYVYDQAELITITSNGGGDDVVIDLAENIRTATVLTATGPGPVYYEIAGGADGGAFTIDSSTGELQFNYAPDFEMANDSNYDNIYEVDVVATDGSSYDYQHITVRIQSVDEAPYFYDGYGAVVALQATENGSYISDLIGRDPEGSQVTYAIVGGADASRFWVDPVTGRFRWVDSFKPNFEAPADAGGNNVYDVTISATSGGLSRTQAFSVTVTNQNEAPVITSNGGGTSASLAIDERQTAVTTVVAVDPESSPVTYSIGGGTHAALFAINSSTGALRFVAAPDFEAPAAGSNNLYTVIVRASAGGHTTSQTLQVRVNDVDEAPTITSNGGGETASVAVAENQSGVTTVAATHADPAAVLVYSIAGGADGSRFAIGASTGILTFVSSPDFEARADADGNGVYDVVVAVSDGSRSDLQTLAVTVSNVNEAPAIAGSQTDHSVVENGAAVATLAANDPDGTALTWSIAGGADAALFAIDPATGALRFVAAPDFEAPADAGADNVYDVIVSASDGSLSATRTLTVQVANSNEAPVFAPGGNALQINEDRTAVATLSAADPEGGALSFAIAGGADAALFAIDPATGALRFLAAPDFEAPADAGGDNVYDVEVSASDGALSVTKSFSIEVANTSPPVAQGPEFVVNSTYQRTQADADVTRLADGNFLVVWIDADYNTTAGRFLRGQIFAPDGVKIGGELTLQSDNNVGVEPAVAALPNGGFVVTSLSGISVIARMYDSAGNATTGRLDVGTGSGLSDPQIAVLANGGFAITWSDKKWTGTDFGSNDVRMRLYDSAGVPVAGEMVVHINTAGEQVDSSIAAFAGGGYVVTWSDTPVRGGATVAKAQIFDSAGVRVGGEITVAGADGYHSVVGTTVVTLTNGNFAVAWSQSIPDGPTAYRIQIFTPEGVKVGGQIVAPSHAYGLIVGPAMTALSDGGLAVAWAPNNPPYYDGSGKAIYVQAYDSAGQPQGAATRVNGQANGDQIEPSIAGLSDGRFVVTWADLNGSGADDDQVMARIFAPEGYVPNQRPVFDSAASIEVDEGRTAVGQVAASDPDGPGAVAYSIAGGAHAALFEIDPATGALSFKAAPDYEAPASGSGNVYTVTVRAGDGELSSYQTLEVVVRNVNEGVTITSGSTASVVENSTAVTIVAATDVDGDAVSFAITGGADSGAFSIDAATGALRFAAEPNFEAPADSDGDNVYQVEVSASDGSLSDTRSIAITVGNADEAVELLSYGGDGAVALSVAENGAQAGQVEARDPDGGAVTYAIVGGADAARFAVDPATGALSFVSDPDFEAAADADGDNVYDVVVAAAAGGSTATQSFAISVTNLNEGISITSDGGGISTELWLDEGARDVTIVTAHDPDGTAPAYSIVGGPDAALFAIDAQTGALSLIEAPDFESPADSWRDNVYTVIVSASDGEHSSEQTVHVSVADVNEGVTITSGGGAEAVQLEIGEDGLQVASVEASDADGDPVAYAISGGADASRFAIDAETGALSFAEAVNFEAPGDADGDNVYEVVVSATDGAFTDSQSYSVTVTDVDDPVRFLSYGGAATVALSVLEDEFSIGTVQAQDDEGPVTYAITGGIDAESFEIDPVTGALSFRQPNAADFEDPTDYDSDGVHEVVVTASSSTSSATQAFMISIANRNEVPGFHYESSLTVNEGVQAITTLIGRDRDGDSTTLAIVGGADAALFELDPVTNLLKFVQARDFETQFSAAGTNVYDVEIEVSDGQLAGRATLQITIRNVNEAVAITSGGGGDTAAVTVPENGTAVTTVAASDVDGDALTYSITGGADWWRFAIDPQTGVLRFVQTQNFEDPWDAGADHVYDVVVSVTDGVLTDSQAIAVTVANVVETVAITSNGGGESVSVGVAENGTAVTTVAASAPGGDRMTYAIAGGADAARFTINADTGALAFVAAPNFEAPSDAGADNVYDVVVSATNGDTVDTQAIAVTVGNVNEPLAITSGGGGASAAVTVSENGSLATTVVAVDADGGPIEYRIFGGADLASFTIDAVTGALTFKVSPNFEAPGDSDGDNVYEVIVRAGDGHYADYQTIAVTVANAVESVVITSNGGGAGASVAVAENGTAVATVAASNPDGGTLTYAIAGGADAARFTINASTGALAFVAAPNFEAPADAGGNNVYDVVVSASNGSSSDTQALAVTVGNVNEPVAITSNGGGSSASVTRAENGTSVAVVAAGDPDGGAVTYAIAGGADASRFTIDAATGALAFIAAPNFEAPADSGGDNVYDVVVSASDGSFTDTQALAVTVSNVAEAPAITSSGGGSSGAVSVAENSLAVVTVAATDPDGTAPTYSIVGGADSARFTINPQTGALQFVAAPDWELPGDSDGDNVYAVVVRASDGQLVDEQALSVTVTNIRDGNTVTGTSGGDSISATSSNVALRTSNEEDLVFGRDGHDTINGMAGDDEMYGEGGNDVLIGGAGADKLFGGLGKDQFTYNAASESTGALRDLIMDFSRSQGDKISLSAIDANSLASNNQAFTFIGTSAFSNVAGQLRYETSAGVTNIYGDVNGDGIADLQIQLSGSIPLIASDFIL